MPHRVPTYRASVPTASRHREYDRHMRDPHAKAFYNSSPWIKLRGMKLRRSPLCEQCQAEEGKLVAATVVHHKQERRDVPELSLDLDNLQSLCPSCHSRMHAAEGG